MSDKHSTRATILSSGHMLHLMQYVSQENSPAAVKRLGEFDSTIEAEHAFFGNSRLAFLQKGIVTGSSKCLQGAMLASMPSIFQSGKLLIQGRLMLAGKW